MLQEKTFIGDEYTPPPQIHELYQRAMLGAAVKSSIYEDDHGTFISGVAPVRDGSDKVVALLQADVRLADYMAQVDADSRLLVMLSLVVLCCIILLSLHMHLLHVLSRNKVVLEDHLGHGKNQHPSQKCIRIDD